MYMSQFLIPCNCIDKHTDDVTWNPSGHTYTKSMNNHISDFTCYQDALNSISRHAEPVSSGHLN